MRLLLKPMPPLFERVPRLFERISLGLAATCALMALGADARPLHYGAVSDPSVSACDQLQWSGQLEAADSCYKDLLNNAEATMASQAEAAWALGEIKLANELFATSNRLDPNNSETLTRWGDLFDYTHQLEEALDLYTQANEQDGDHIYAAVGAADVLLRSYAENAGAYLDAVLAQGTDQPGAILKALLIKAFLLIQADGHNDAEEVLAEAEKLAIEHAFPLLEIYALKAAINVRRRLPPEEWIDRALQINPHYGDAYAIAAHMYRITFKYDQAGEYFQKAVDVQPNHWLAQLELAANHLRQNRSTLARDHFEIAFAGDPYNPEAVNSMRLMETYESFDILNYPEASSGQRLPDLSLRLARSERDLLAPYASSLAAKAIETFEQRYEFKLRETAHIEIYPNHDDFIVRALGMPGTPLLGVAFGYLIALDSPSAKAGGSYHWGTTLWHEMAHIFTIKASNHNVPRWFTEGISVFEEWSTGPIPGIRVPMHVYASLQEHEFLPVTELDAGFTRTTYENQVLVSYMQAGLICDYIARTQGFDKLVALLAAYAEGLSTEQAIERVLLVDPEDFDKAFAAYFQREHSATMDNMDQWAQLVGQAAARLQQEQWQLAIEHADAAIALIPTYSEPDSPYLIKASAQKELELWDKQFETLNRYWQQGGYSASALDKLSELMVERDLAQQAIEVLKALNLVDPFNLQAHLRLGDLLLASGNPENVEQALTEYRVAMALEPLDKAAVLYRLGSAYQQAGQQEQARTNALAALEIAPHYRPAQRLLMSTLER